MAAASPVRPEHLHYDTIEEHLLKSISAGSDFLFDGTLFDDELTRLWRAYDVPYQSLQSFVRNLHVAHVKRTAPVVKRTLPSLVNDYVKGRSIKEMSKKVNYPPYLFSRYLVEAITDLKGKKALSEAMKHPLEKLIHSTISTQYLESERFDEQLPTTRLARQVQAAMESDPMHGPMHDKERHMVGVEFEVVLEYKLRKMKIPFETEAQLRDRGTSRTPDVLLSAPLGIEVPKKDGTGKEWKVVCWIDSKALFGDVHTHRTSVLPQAESYVHRFGPGLVLYWFGHAPLDRLGDGQGDISILGWELPNFMLPTGESLTLDTQQLPL